MTMVGTVLMVQEGRFMLRDDGGVSHLFVLSAGAAAETAQLPGLMSRRVRVVYRAASDVIGNAATAVEVA